MITRSSAFAERVRSVDPPRRRRAVTHDFAVFALFEKGTCRIEQRGSWTAAAGDVLVVPAGEAHHRTSPDPVQFWRASICVPCVLADGGGEILLPFERVRDGAAPIVRIPEDRRPFLTALFADLGGYGGAPPGITSVQRSLVSLISHEIARAASWTVEAAPERTLVADILRFIEHRCLGPLSLTEIARATHRSASYITTVLTRATGKSAGAWILAGRMAEARRQLLHSDERIDVIAERVGYGDVTHFIRTFRRVHGSTPAQWRSVVRHPVPASAEVPVDGELRDEARIQHAGRAAASRRTKNRRLHG